MATKDPENLFNFILYRFRMNLTTFESWSTTSRPTTTLPTTSRPTTSRPTTTTRRTTPRPTTSRLTTTRLHWHPRLARHVRCLYRLKSPSSVFCKINDWERSFITYFPSIKDANRFSKLGRERVVAKTLSCLLAYCDKKLWDICH